MLVGILPVNRPVDITSFYDIYPCSQTVMLTFIHCVSIKTCKLWNGIAQNYKDRFW